MPALQDPRTETYQDVQRLIWKTVYEFQRRYGGEFDELMSTANLAFAISYNKHDPAKSSFVTWVRNYVWYTLMNDRRPDIIHPVALLGENDVDVKQTPVEIDPFEISLIDPSEAAISDLFDMVGEDAAEVLGLVLNTPDDLHFRIMQKGGTPGNWRSTVREHLLKLGWGAERVRESFREIQEALA